MKRRKMNRQKSRRSFTKHARTINRRNLARPKRLGTRL